MKYIKLLSVFFLSMMLSSNGFAFEDVGIAFAGAESSKKISAQVNDDRIECISGDLCQEVFDQVFPKDEKFGSYRGEISGMFVYGDSSLNTAVTFSFDFVEIEGKTYRALVQGGDVDMPLMWIDPKADY